MQKAVKMDVCMWICLIVASILLQKSEGAVKVDAREKLTRFRRDVPRHIRYKRSTASLSDIFELTEGESLEVEKEAKTAQGTKVYKLTETYRGKSVFDTVITMTADSKQTPLDAHGYFVQEIHKDEQERHRRSLSRDELFDILIKGFKDEKHHQHIGSRKFRHDIFVDENDVAHRVAVLEYLIQTKYLQKRPTGIIDIKTGEIMLSWNNLATCRSYMRGRMFGGNYKVGRIRYGVAPNCLEMTEDGKMCYLENEHVKVVDMLNTEYDDLTEAAHFLCRRRYPDSINGAYSPALDALYHGTIVGKMFKEWFQSTPLNERMILRVHFSHHYDNAFWNGYNCSFGDGIPGLAYPFTSLDIIGHEIAHGITEENSRLLYIGEAGAINEAFSDITGEMAELYANNVDWTVGYAVKVSGSMRPFGDPDPYYDTAITHVNHYRPNMNAHDASGIYNRVFFLLVYEYELSPKDVYGVFLHANRMYWHPMTNFETGACDIMLAAYDKGLDGEPFSRAFAEVGINVCDIDDHIVYLRHNTSFLDVTVSTTVNPVFAFEAPEWGKKVFVEASSKEADIHIKVFYDRWTNVNGSTPSLVEGYDSVHFMLPRYSRARKYIIRLSTQSPKELNDVQIKGSYTCSDRFRSYNSVMKAYYWECYGIDLSGD